MRLKRTTPSAPPDATPDEPAREAATEAHSPAAARRPQGLLARLGLGKGDASSSAQMQPMRNPLGWLKRDARESSNDAPDTPWHAAPGWAKAQEALAKEATSAAAVGPRQYKPWWERLPPADRTSEPGSEISTDRLSNEAGSGGAPLAQSGVHAPARVDTLLRLDAGLAAEAALEALQHLARQRELLNRPAGDTAAQREQVQRAEEAVQHAMPRVREMRKAMGDDSVAQTAPSSAIAASRLTKKDT
jgi:hypothetical protein